MGMTVEIDGSAVGFGRIHLPSGGDVRVGPFLLRILPTAAGSEDVSIDIERAEDDATLEKVDVRRFALASVMPGKRRMAWISAILVLGIFLAWPIWSFYQGRTEAGALRPGLSSGPDVECRGRCRAATPRSSTIARPATSSPSSRSATRIARPATPTSTTMPIRAGCSAPTPI